MTVEPGFGGQSFLTETLESVRGVKQLAEAKGKNIMIEVDGGINKDNIRTAYKAGADVFVAGSSVFRAPVPADAVADLRRACE